MAGQEEEIEAIEPPLTPLRYHYLLRLRHLTDLRASYKTDPNCEAWLMYAINKAILATRGEGINGMRKSTGVRGMTSWSPKVRCLG